MKNALIAAVVAAIVSASSAVAATTYINGRTIRPHSIPLNRLAQPLPTVQFTRVVGTAVAVQPGIEDDAVALCPQGSEAIAGGFVVRTPPTDGQIAALASWPLTGNSNGWGVFLLNTATDPATVQAYATCASATS